MTRAIFPELDFLKKAVTERSLVATREIYKQHPVYTFADDEETSKILLYPSYGDIKYQGKKPMIVFKTGGYSFSLLDTLNRNVSNVARDAAGVIAGSTYEKLMNTSITTLIQAYTEEESSDLADEFAMLAGFACIGMYGQVGLLIRAVQVSETDIQDSNAGVYQTVVTLAVEYLWEATNIKGEAPIDYVEIETEQPETIGPLRTPPGIEIFRGKLSELKPLT